MARGITNVCILSGTAPAELSSKRPSSRMKNTPVDNPILQRTQLTLNIAVPFSGTSVLAQLTTITLGLVMNAIGGVLIPSQMLKEFFWDRRDFSFPFGINKIPWQLWLDAERNERADDRFRELVKKTFNHLQVRDARGWRDQAAPRRKFNEVRFPFGHTSILKAYSERDTGVTHVVEAIRNARPTDLVATGFVLSPIPRGTASTTILAWRNSSPIAPRTLLR